MMTRTSSSEHAPTACTFSGFDGGCTVIRGASVART